MEILSDSDLIENIKNANNVDESLQELINRHSGIYLEMVNAFLRNCNNDSLKDDIVSEKALIIYNSALKYDSTKGTKFSTFLGNEAKWTCLNASNKNKKFLELNDQNFDFQTLKEEKETEKEDFKNQILNKFRKHLDVYPDKRVSKIFNMRYENVNKLTPWRKISKEMDLSIQGCINIHNSALKTIAKKIKLEYEFNS
jgi:DNA-directed RNA polymerase specialized sigma subunit